MKAVKSSVYSAAGIGIYCIGFILQAYTAKIILLLSILVLFSSINN